MHRRQLNQRRVDLYKTRLGRRNVSKVPTHISLMRVLLCLIPLSIAALPLAPSVLPWTLCREMTGRVGSRTRAGEKDGIGSSESEQEVLPAHSPKNGECLVVSERLSNCSCTLEVDAVAV